MSEFEFWRLAGMAHEASGSGQKPSVGAGKGGGFGRTGMSVNTDDDPRFQMNARVSKQRVKPLPKVSSRMGGTTSRKAFGDGAKSAPKRSNKLGSSPSRGGSLHAKSGRAPSAAHAPANPAAAGYRPQTAPLPGQPRGVFVRTNSQTIQRAVFKGTQKHVGSLTTYQQFVAALRGKAVYMTKNGKDRDGGAAEAFTDEQERVDARAVVDRWISDGDISASWHSLSPEHGNRIDNFQDYMRRTMSKVERDLLTKQELSDGHRLEWLGAEHNDTDHRHGHVAIRHRVNGKHIRIDQDYLNHGMEVRAREAATEVLGERHWREIDATAKREQTQDYKDERLRNRINKRTLGWRLEAKINMRDLDGVDRLRGALRSAKVHHKLNSQTGDLIIFSSSHATSIATAEAIAADFGSLLRLPDAAAMKRGMQFGQRIWGRFVVPNTDERFDQTGVGGVPLLRDDIERIRSSNGNAEMLTDAAVLRANEVLAKTYRDKLIGSDATKDDGLVTHGWVLNINADYNVHKVAAELTDLGVQYRLRKELDATGQPALMVVAYVGSTDDADYVAGHISDRLGSELRPIDRGQGLSHHYFADGIDGRFIPHANDRQLLGIDERTPYLDGLPMNHFCRPEMTPEQKVAVAEDFLTGIYGGYLQGSAGGESETTASTEASARLPALVSTPVEQVAEASEKPQPAKIERRPDGLER